jgi:hypothetical protein
MKHMKHMIGCVAMVAVIAVVYVARGADTPSWLPIVLVLCCPLMMIAMLFMMRGDHQEDAAHRETGDVQHADRR